MEIKGQTCPENMERYLIRLINFDQYSAVHAVRRTVGAEEGEHCVLKVFYADIS